MILKTFELKDFRNYESEEIVFHEKINILTGRNAQGKTNLIEAINLLALGKSFRTRKEQELVRFGAEEARVKGTFRKRDRTQTTEVRLYAGASGKKNYIVDGLETETVADLLGGVYTIVFSPEDLRIVKGDPETRRKFLDREIILQKPMYYHKLKRYRHALKTRNALLKSEKMSGDLLDIYDLQLAESASEVMKERGAWLKALSEAAGAAGGRITDGAESVRVEYRPNISQIGDECPKEAIAEHFARNRERDILARATEAGPHRDDFAVFERDIDLRVYGSQGQQRTAALALRLAEREMIKREAGEDAILLLDDVMSELDEGRQERLLGSFGENQIFITAALWPPNSGEKWGADTQIEDAKVIRIEKGRIV